MMIFAILFAVCVISTSGASMCTIPTAAMQGINITTCGGVVRYPFFMKPGATLKDLEVMRTTSDPC